MDESDLHPARLFVGAAGPGDDDDDDERPIGDPDDDDCDDADDDDDGDEEPLRVAPRHCGRPVIALQHATRFPDIINPLRRTVQSRYRLPAASGIGNRIPPGNRIIGF